MSDLRYIVVCKGSNNKLGYHSSEPEKMSEYLLESHTGGFSYRISDAIVHTNIILAHIERRRMATIYNSYTMKVKTITAKNLFKERLGG